MKLSKAFRCVRPGEIYPVELAIGDECPEVYEDSARALGCLDPVEAEKAPAKKK